MRVLKIAGIVLGALVGLLVLGAIALMLWVDPNDYRDEIARRAAAALGRPVTIAGSLDLDLFPWIALRVADLTVGNPPGYGSEPFLTVKQADVGVKLLPLLRKEVEVRRVTLEGLAATLISRSDEDNNWKDLGESESEDSGPSAAPSRTSISGLDLKDATLIYRDEAERSTTRLTHLQLAVGAFGDDAPLPVRAQFVYDDGNAESALALAIETVVLTKSESSRVELQDLVVKGRPSAGGTEFSVRAPRAALDWQAETLEPADLDVRYGELPIRVSASGVRIFSNRDIKGKIAIAQLSPRDVLPSLDIEVPRARDPIALTRFSLDGNLRLTEQALRVSQLVMRLDDTRVRGSIGIDDLDAKSLSFDLDVDRIDVDRYREPQARKDPAAGKSGPPVDLPRDAIRELDARGSLRIGHATFADMKFDDIELPVEAKDGRVLLAPKAKLFGGRYEGDIMLDARQPKLRLSMNEHVRDIDAGALVNAAFDSTRLVGRGDANIVLTGAGNTDVEMFKSLAGQFDAKVRQGAFNGVDLWFELRRAIALVKRSALPTRSGPVRTRFKALSASATLAKGIISSDDLRVDLDYVKARGKGSLKLADQSIDYRLVAELYEIPPASEGGRDMADLKSVEIPITITGTMADMKVRPDVEGILKARVRKEVDKQKEKLRKKLDDKLGDKLKDLLNR